MLYCYPQLSSLNLKAKLNKAILRAKATKDTLILFSLGIPSKRKLVSDHSYPTFFCCCTALSFSRCSCPLWQKGFLLTPGYSLLTLAFFPTQGLHWFRPLTTVSYTLSVRPQNDMFFKIPFQAHLPTLNYIS